MTKQLTCQSCGGQKQMLKTHKSTISGSELIMCNTCITKGYEPRYLLIIAYNTGGRLKDKAIRCIRQGSYVGDRILLEETL